MYACIADAQQFVKHHPVIYKADKTAENEYVFYEKIRILLIPYKLNYKVQFEECKLNESVKMYSEVQKGVHLHLFFSFKSLTNKTFVMEEVKIEAPFVVKQILQIALKRAHKKVFNNINKI